MIKWIDRITNWGHIVIPLFIALVVFLLGRLGCHEGPTQRMESMKSNPEVSRSYAAYKIETNDKIGSLS